MAATARAVDLTKVKEGGSFRPKRKPAGDYRATIIKADDHIKEGKEPGWVLTIQVDGDARASYPYYLNPAEKQRWKIGAICRAAGLNVIGKRVNFNPNKLVGKSIGVALDDDEYEGRPKSVIDDVFPVDEVSPNAGEGAPDAEEYDDADGEELESDYDQDAEDEEEPDPTPPPRKRARKAAPPPPEEDEDEDEEQEEEEPPPPPRRRRAAAPPAKKTAARKAAPPPADEDDEDVDDIDLDDLDD